MKAIVAALTAFAVSALPSLTHAEKTGAAPENLPALNAYALYECVTDTCILESNAAESYDVAGLSKLAGVLTVCEAMDDGMADANGSVTVSKRAADIAGPSAFLEENEKIAISELLKASVMISAGDAIYALMESLYGSESVFIDNIAVTLQETDTALSLTDPLGTDTKLSANALLRLSRKAAMSETFMKYARLFIDTLPHGDGRETELVSANRLLRFYTGCDGLMTGSSQTAGYCGVYHASRNGMELICVVIGAASAAARSTAAEALLDCGFSNYTVKKLASENGVIVPAIPVQKGAVKSVDLISKETVGALLPKTNAKLTEERDVPESLAAPVRADTPVGSIRYLDETGNAKAIVNLYASVDVERFGYLDILKEIVSDFVR